MFVDREVEIDALNRLLIRPAAQFAVVYGRRRVGKTTLLLEWSRRSGLSTIYWVSSKESSTLLLRSFSQTIYAHMHPDTSIDPLFSYPSWEMAFREVAAYAKEQRIILIIDEFAYAVQSEGALPSILQNAWDHAFKQSQIILMIAGSQVGMMIDMLGYHAPLYGRMTAQLSLKPLPFRALTKFYPNYSAERRVAVYAILGGIPAYLEQFSQEATLGENVSEQILSLTSVFLQEPFFLLQDEVKEVNNYFAILRSIGEGAHTLNDISLRSGIARNHASTYLARLQELTFVQREIPATLPTNKRTTQGRYILADAYLRFYFRFIAPNRTLLEQGLINRLWHLISEGMRAFVGQTAFEEICRTWTMAQAAKGNLPFIPDRVGRHWSPDSEIDVVVINWREKQILLGECKWGEQLVQRKVIHSLIYERGPRVLAKLEGEWQCHYAFFARSGFTNPAKVEAKSVDAFLINLTQLDADLKGSEPLFKDA